MLESFFRLYKNLLSDHCLLY